MSVKKLIIDFMEEYHLTQTETAGLLGISIYTISRWLHGKENLERERLIMLALSMLYCARGNTDKGLELYRSTMNIA